MFVHSIHRLFYLFVHLAIHPVFYLSIHHHSLCPSIYLINASSFHPLSILSVLHIPPSICLSVHLSRGLYIYLSISLSLSLSLSHSVIIVLSLSFCLSLICFLHLLLQQVHPSHSSVIHSFCRFSFDLSVYRSFCRSFSKLHTLYRVPMSCQLTVTETLTVQKQTLMQEHHLIVIEGSAWM